MVRVVRWVESGWGSMERKKAADPGKGSTASGLWWLGGYRVAVARGGWLPCFMAFVARVLKAPKTCVAGTAVVGVVVKSFRMGHLLP